MEGLRVAAGPRLDFLDEKGPKLVLFLRFIHSSNLIVKHANDSGIFDDYKFAVMFFDHLRLMREIPVELSFEWAFHRVKEYESRRPNNQ